MEYTLDNVKNMNKQIKNGALNLLKEARSALSSRNNAVILLILNSLGEDILELIKIENQDEFEAKESMKLIANIPDFEKTELDNRFLNQSNIEIEEIKYERSVLQSLLNYIVLSLRSGNYNGLLLIITLLSNIEMMRNLRLLKVGIEDTLLDCEELDVTITGIVIDDEICMPTTKLNSQYRSLKNIVNDDLQKIKRL